MSCKICNRSSCTESFHSLEEQEAWEERQTMSDDVDTLRRACQEWERGYKEKRQEVDHWRDKHSELFMLHEALKDAARPFVFAAKNVDAASTKQKQMIGSEISPEASPGWGIERRHLDAIREILSENSGIDRPVGNDGDNQP